MARRWHWRAVRGSVVYSLLVLFSSRCADVQEGMKVGDSTRAPSSQSATLARFELDVSVETIKPVSGAQWYCEERHIYEQPPNPSNVTPQPYDCSPPPPYEGPGVISKQCSSYQPGGDCGGCWLTGSHPPNGTEEMCYYDYGVSTSNCTTTGSCTLEKLKTKWFPSTMDNTGAFTIDQRTCAEGSVQVFENYMNYAFVNGVYVKVPDYIISRRTNQGDAFSLTVVNGGTRECKNAYELCQNGFSVVSFPSKTFNLDCSEVGPTPTPPPTVTPDPCAPSDGFSLDAGQCTPTPTPTPKPRDYRECKPERDKTKDAEIDRRLGARIAEANAQLDSAERYIKAPENETCALKLVRHFFGIHGDLASQRAFLDSVRSRMGLLARLVATAQPKDFCVANNVSVEACGTYVKEGPKKGTVTVNREALLSSSWKREMMSCVVHESLHVLVDAKDEYYCARRTNYQNAYNCTAYRETGKSSEEAGFLSEDRKVKLAFDNPSTWERFVWAAEDSRRYGCPDDYQ